MYLLYGARDAVGNGPRGVGKGVSFYLLLGEWHCGSWFAGGGIVAPDSWAWVLHIFLS